MPDRAGLPPGMMVCFLHCLCPLRQGPRDSRRRPVHYPLCGIGSSSLSLYSLGKVSFTSLLCFSWNFQEGTDRKLSSHVPHGRSHGLRTPGTGLLLMRDPASPACPSHLGSTATPPHHACISPPTTCSVITFPALWVSFLPPQQLAAKKVVSLVSRLCVLCVELRSRAC